jgi:signal transduction histidine kinase/ligand-binding sensor domain-containing protein
MPKKKFAFFLFFLTVYASSFSQKIEFEHISDKDGLVSSSITTITRDSYGYMWFGTFNGLSKYDGYSFTNYLNDPKDSSSITDNQIQVLYQAIDSVLYIGTAYAGFCTYNRETESFTRYTHDPNNSNSLGHNSILTIFGDRDGQIWIGTRQGLDKFDPQTKKFTHYAPPKSNRFFVSAISEDEDGILWLYGIGQCIYKFDPEKNTFESISVIANYNVNNSSWGTALKLDSRGMLWIGTEGYGLVRYNTKTGEKDLYSVENGKLKSNYVFSVIEDSEGTIWVGSDGGGVYLYSYSTDSFKIFGHEPNDLSSLSGNGVYTIYESDPGMVWVGVYASGLNVYKRDKQKFEKFTSIGSPGKCLSNKSVLSIVGSEDGLIWLGTDGGGLNMFDPKKNHFTYYTTQNSIIHSDIIKSIFLDKEDNFWLGSYGKGLGKLNLKKGTIRTFRGNLAANGKTILNDHVWAINQSVDRKIWLGLVNFGINVYDPLKDEFNYYPFDPASFSKSVSNINVLIRDSKNRIWVGTEISGLGYFDPVTNKLVRFPYEDGKAGSINSNHIFDIYEDSKGNIWIATLRGGLNRVVDVEKGIFENFTMKNGLPTNNIHSILEDDDHRLWLSTDKGISSFDLKTKKITNFDIEDGLQSQEFNMHSALKTKEGYMYFGGIQGFNKFHPDSIHFNTAPPRVVLTDFKLFNKSIVPNQEKNGMVYLKKSISLSNEITLTHQDYIFSLEFAALDFTSPQKNRYAYRLIGFNDQWTYVDADKRFATYTNLDPGYYTFQVIACNNDDVWNTKGTSLSIVILPPWWQTWWFRAALAITIVLLVVLFFYIRLKSIKSRNKFLVREVRKRTAELKEANTNLMDRNERILRHQEKIVKQKNELELKKMELELLDKTKNKFFSIIGHDLKGPVKALRALTAMLKKETDSVLNDTQKALISHIDLTSNSIQNLVFSLLEWARAQSGQVTVNFACLDVFQILNENKDLLSEQAFQKEIKIQIESSSGHYIMGDYNMISTIVRNILSNSIKYTPKGGSITLSSTLTNTGEVKISIADTGIGMSPGILKTLFSLDKGFSIKGTDNETGTGLGMLISKEFSDLNKGNIYAESTLGKGTIVYLVFPAAEKLSVQAAK